MTQARFTEFDSEEISMGLTWASAQCGVTLHHDALRIVGNEAGGLMRSLKLNPRDATARAIRQVERRKGITIPPERFEAYVKAVAKMLSNRSGLRRSSDACRRKATQAA